MKTLLINKLWLVGYTLTLCLALWYFLPRIVQVIDTTAGVIDVGVWQLLLFGIIAFIALLGLCCGVFYFIIGCLGLPNINSMVSQFQRLTLWQQFALYLALFALLFLAGVLSLIAVF
jgi:hypothetical protein